MDKTNIKAIRETFIDWLNSPVKEGKTVGTLIEDHPVFQNTLVPIYTINNGIEHLNILYSMYRTQYIEYIESNSINWLIYDYIINVSPQFRLIFVKSIIQYLSEKDLEKSWLFAYRHTPNPNYAKYLKRSEIIDTFRKIDKRTMVDKTKEYLRFFKNESDININDTDATFKVYRGVDTYDPTEAYATDWYLNRKDAEKSSDIRYSKNMIIYEAEISFNDMFYMYTNLNDKTVVILDFEKLQNIHQINNKQVFISGIVQ